MEAIKLWVTRTLVSTLLRNVYMFLLSTQCSRIIHIVLHSLSTTLTASSKVRTKLLNPIGVTEGILLDCQNEVERRREELDVDIMTLRLLTSQTYGFAKELQTDVIDKCLNDVRNAIVKKSNVAKRVMEELSLIDQLKLIFGGRSTFDTAWEKANNDGLENDLTSIVKDCTDNISSRAHNQGYAANEYLGKRPIIQKERMVGSVTIPKFASLKELQPSTTSMIKQFIATLPDDSQYKDQVYTSLSRTALFSSMIMGSALIPVTLNILEVSDAVLTDFLGSATLIVLGGMSLPLGNHKLSLSIEKQWKDKAMHLCNGLESLFTEALHQVKSDLSTSISPYSTFVQSEEELLKDLTENVSNGISSARNLRSKINQT